MCRKDRGVVVCRCECIWGWVGECVRGMGRGVSCEERKVWCVEDANWYMHTYVRTYVGVWSGVGKATCNRPSCEKCV